MAAQHSLVDDNTDAEMLVLIAVAFALLLFSGIMAFLFMYDATPAKKKKA